jgi:hypothetical protein
MSVTPSGYTAEALDNLRTMLSNCVTFQKLTQSANAAAALTKIFRFAKKGQPTRPFALLMADDFRRDSKAGGSRAYYHSSGSMWFSIEVDIERAATITGVTSDTVFTAAALAGLADDYFNGLELTLTSGAQKDSHREVLDFNGATGQLTIASGLAAQLVNTTFKIGPLDLDDMYLHFLKTLDAIIAEMEALSNTGGYLHLTSINRDDYGEVRADQRSGGEYMVAQFSVEFGP